MKTAFYLTLFIAPSTLAACTVETPEDVFSTSDPIVCASNDDCPSGLECEQEDAGSFCKPHGGGGGAATSSSNACVADADCPAGEECELEHGGSFCKPHGGAGGADDNGGSGGADDNSGSGGSASSNTNLCLTDADCPVGEECELQPSGNFCKPHGGN